MHSELYYQLADFAHLARQEESPERLGHIFITSVASGMSVSRKNLLYRDIINRLAYEVGLDVDLGTVGMCVCGCGREFDIRIQRGRVRQYFDASCRKRAQRKREVTE